MLRSVLRWILTPFAFAYGAAYPVRAWMRARRDGISVIEAFERMAIDAKDAAAREGLFLLPDNRMIEARVFDDMPEEPGPGPLWELRLSEGESIVGRPLNSALAELLGHDVAHAQWPTWIDDLAEEIEATRRA
jgi:hypothetical protein